MKTQLAPQTNATLSRSTAVIVALVGMWLFGCAGIYLMLRQGDWWFLGLGGYDVNTLGQLGGFSLAHFGAQLPAMAFGAFIISLAGFQHPLRVAFYIALGLHLFLLGLRVLRWPWAQFLHLNQSIPVLGELVELSLIVGCTVLFTWLFVGPFRRGFRR